VAISRVAVLRFVFTLRMYAVGFPPQSGFSALLKTKNGYEAGRIASGLSGCHVCWQISIYRI